jgi:DNA-binding transcriptional regulator YbjK
MSEIIAGLIAAGVTSVVMLICYNVLYDTAVRVARLDLLLEQWRDRMKQYDMERLAQVSAACVIVIVFLLGWVVP